jgi:hypothetical protein
MSVYRGAWAYRLFEQLELRMSRRFVVDGIWVGVFGDKADEAILEKLRGALELIKAHDPYRYRLVRREVERIWVHLLPGDRSEWVAEEKRCTLDARAVLSASAEDIGASIIHETIRARLGRRGVGYSGHIQRQRVETACMRQELLFAARIPGSEKLEERIKARMALPADYWANRSFRQRLATGEIDMARYAQVPDWVVKIAFALRRLRAGLR